MKDINDYYSEQNRKANSAQAFIKGKEYGLSLGRSTAYESGRQSGYANGYTNGIKDGSMCSQQDKLNEYAKGVQEGIISCSQLPGANLGQLPGFVIGVGVGALMLALLI